VIHAPVGPRSPPARWEAYFLIGIFPAGSVHAWVKAHVFVGQARRGRHSLSAVEALDGPGEAVVLAADASEVRRDAWPIDAESCERTRGEWAVKAPRLEWSGFPATTLAIRDLAVHATATAGTGAWWVHIPRVLSYWSAFGTVTWRDASGESSGMVLLERAWGTDAPVDVAWLSPRRWHWDVLTTGGGSVCAGLSVSGMGIRTMSRTTPNEEIATGWRTRVRVTAWREEPGRRVPARWNGVLRTRAGILRYEALTATPLAPIVPGGGFIGTTWQGEWRGRAVEGTGFTEYRAA
jgi:hypothetical protein